MLVRNAHRYHAAPIYVYYVESVGNTFLRCQNYKDSGVYYEDARSLRQYIVKGKYNRQQGSTHLSNSYPLPCILCNFCDEGNCHVFKNGGIDIIAADNVPSYVKYLEEGKDLNTVFLPEEERNRLGLFDRFLLIRL